MTTGYAVLMGKRVVGRRKEAELLPMARGTADSVPSRLPLAHWRGFQQVSVATRRCFGASATVLRFHTRLTVEEEEISTFSFLMLLIFYTESNNFPPDRVQKILSLGCSCLWNCHLKNHWPGAHFHGLQPSTVFSSKDHRASIWISIVTIQKWKTPILH